MKVLTLRVPVAERCCSHVTQADGAFATAVHKYIALVWMALSSCDYFCQFLHVGGLDVYNIWEHTVKEPAVLRFMIIQCTICFVYRAHISYQFSDEEKGY